MPLNITNDPAPYNHAAQLLAARGLHSQAIPLFHTAATLAATPLDRAGALNNLAESLLHQGHLQQAAQLLHQAAAATPPHHPIRSNALRILAFLPNADPLDIRRQHEAWWSNLPTAPPPPLPQPTRPLRVGLLSPDLRHHAVASFLLPLLEHADPADIHFFCYANLPQPDPISHRIAQRSTWRDILSLPDPDAAALIRNDHLHFLIDLAGHTNNHRLPLFALNPAPLQLTYLGYPQTTGSPFIHYRLTDALADPPGTTDPHNTERLLRLPTTAWCFTPLVPLPPPPPNPAPRPFTFGSFNANPKLSPFILDLWAQILAAAPHTRLLLKNPALADEPTRTRLTAHFAAHHISPDRLTFLPFNPDPAAHLAAYHLIDLALDTFPYHGTTTTCEALAMLIPVLTLTGQTHASRVGVSLLTNAHLPTFITPTPEAYLAQALACATNPSLLPTARHTLHTTLPTSPLLNAPQFTQDFLTTLHSLLPHPNPEIPPSHT
ncbi:MAG TPA: glycosyltransferase [Phycisphaerae bacterium]|nr:glycosyltransferase [Phycisphaerae bacterium]